MLGAVPAAGGLGDRLPELQRGQAQLARGAGTLDAHLHQVPGQDLRRATAGGGQLVAELGVAGEQLAPGPGGPQDALVLVGAPQRLDETAKARPGGLGLHRARTVSEVVAPAPRGRYGILRRMAATASDTAALLANVPVFEDLAPPELQRIADVAVPRTFEPGQVVFREGDASDTCYVVSSGHARATRTHTDGRSITLATFGPGDFFGELAMFDDERRSATVEAIDGVSACAILGHDMRGFLARHPEIAVKLVTALGRRLRAANERLTRQSFQTVQSRVAQVVARLVADAQREGAPDHEVPLKVTQSEIADLAGCSRESASRFLAVLERASVIDQGRGRLTVHDPAALERYVL